ncbi:penicillin-binding protein 2 [bacterium]|nr:MAG: penicillin-binding protein 2 [bacterium]
MSVIHAPRKPELEARLLVFPLVMAGALGVLFLRLWYFQVVKAGDLSERATASQEMTVATPAPRGLMVDRYGELVAGVRPELVVTAVPSMIEKHPETLDKLAALLSVDVKKLKKRVEEAFYRRHLPTPIYVGVPVDIGSRIAEAGDDLPGIDVESRSMRYYPDSKSISHLMGYVSVPSERDVERLKSQGIEPADYVGKGGVERAYESDLMGAKGEERLEIDAKRRPVRILGRDASVPGKRLQLTIDLDLQRYVTALLAQAGHKGAIVALEPSTGEVLAMVSAPTYDLSLFKGGITKTDWDLLNNDPRKPMLNRAIQSAYAPGSTFKIVTTLSAQENGMFDSNAYIYCNGGFQLGRHRFGCLGHHGAIPFERAMEKSCNTYFSTLGYRLGREKLLKTAEEVGLGARTGVELTGEVRGDLPNDRWIKRARKPAVWYGGDVVNASLGQGAVNTTPLQMASVASLVANDGVSYVPHFVRSIHDADSRGRAREVQPEIGHKVEASADFWATLKHALVGVIQEGTAKVAKIDGVVWGGKTGSAEHRRGTNTHGWFVGVAPMESPRIAVAVVLESAGHGGDVAAPLAREVVRHYLASLAKRAAKASASAAPLPSPKDR